MASGFGITGKKGRCYDVWMDFSDCMSHCAMPAECTSRRDDYFECLHHRKEVSASCFFRNHFLNESNLGFFQFPGYCIRHGLDLLGGSSGFTTESWKWNLELAGSLVKPFSWF